MRSKQAVTLGILADADADIIKLHILLADLANVADGDDNVSSQVQPITLDLLSLASSLRCAVGDVRDRLGVEEDDDHEHAAAAEE